MSDRNDVHSAARISATRTLLAGFRQGGEKAIPVLVSEGFSKPSVVAEFVLLRHDAGVGEVGPVRPLRWRVGGV